MDVIVGRSRIPIDTAVFLDLFENSAVSERAPVQHALETSEISYPALVELARTAQIPHPLFFAPLSMVRQQVRAKTEKLMQGVRPDTFTVNTRTTIRLADVELIVKDLLRKQALLRRHDPTLVRNPIVGLLKKPRRSIKEDADALTSALGLDLAAVRALGRKDFALESLIAKLEANQILVSRSVQNYMPQRITVHFSGMTVRDTKVPYIFLAGGNHQDDQEPAGRQIFTLTLMTVLIARGIFAPVTFNARSAAPSGRREYGIVEEVLMPAAELHGLDLTDLDAVVAAADRFKVTPSAMTVRALHTGIISHALADDFLQELQTQFRNATKPRPRQPKPVTAIRKYNGRELVSRLLGAVDDHRLPASEFYRVVCMNRLGPADLGELRAAIR